MASVTENNGSTMTDREDPRDEDQDDEREERKPEPLAYRGPQPVVKGDEGFFTIRKPGQGYWTRMLTAVAAGLLIIGTAYFIYRFVLSGAKNNTRLIVSGAFVVVGSILSWYLMNKPQNVDFLVATDSEMKKVNWTSRHELMGSTKVVIFFMFLIAFMLFGFDIVFGYLFKWITVLKHGPFD